MTSTTNSRRHASGLWLSTLAVLVSALSCARSPVKTSPPPAERTTDILRRRGIDMSKVSRATWENRPVFVVGADAGDSTSKQFWIDAQRLLFVRLVETVKTSNGSRRDEYRFQRYVPHGQSWVAEEVTGLRDGKPSLREVYANVRVDVPIDDALFDPAQLATHTPWYKRNPAQ